MLFFLLACICAPDTPMPDNEGLPEEVHEDPLPPQTVSEKTTAMVLHQTIGISKYMRKVDRIVQTYRQMLERRDKDKPLIVVLGSSSSGGQSVIHTQKMTFWPIVLQAELPDVNVQSIAMGGATSWHMRHALYKMNIYPDVCVLYMGHNDGMRKSPRQTLAELEKGTKPKSGEFVRWVTLNEARENILMMSTKCKHFVAMPEYTRTADAAERLIKYSEMLKKTEGIVFIDLYSIFQQYPDGELTGEGIYPTEKGHQLIGKLVAEKIKPLLE